MYLFFVRRRFGASPATSAAGDAPREGTRDPSAVTRRLQHPRAERRAHAALATKRRPPGASRGACAHARVRALGRARRRARRDRLRPVFRRAPGGPAREWCQARTRHRQLEEPRL